MDEQQALTEFKTNAVLFTPVGEQRGVMVALYPDSVVAQQLASLPGATVPADQIHLTLAFLGNVDALTDQQVARSLLTVSSMARDSAPLAGTVQGLGRFNATPSSDGQDVIYAVPDVPGLAELRHRIAGLLSDYGVPVSATHGFNPHLTLAYVEPGSEWPVPTVPTLPLRLDRVSLVVGDRRLDFPLSDLRFNSRVEIVANAAVTVKEITHKGRSYLVSPAVPIREGVLNGEYVPASEIERFALAWNGRPMPLGHPKDGEGFISANSPDLWDETPAFFWNATAKDGALSGEVWLDVEKAQALGGLATQALTRLRTGQPIELSTAYFRELEPGAGTFGGKEYRGVARNLRPDHIAILLDEPGACSWVDGCGTPRVNAQVDASQTFIAEGLQTLARNLVKTLTPGGRKVDRDQMIGALVANRACRCTKEQLEGMDEETLKVLSESIAPAVNTETPAPQAAVVPPPQQPAVPAEVLAFTEALQAFGGIEKLQAALTQLATNADKERTDLVALLVANEKCTLAKEELDALSVDALKKLHSAFAPKVYAGNGGTFVSNRQEAKSYVLAMPNPFKEEK